MSPKTSLEVEAVRDGDYIDPAKKIILGLQHMFTMFGATVLVPIITGLNISVACLWQDAVHCYFMLSPSVRYRHFLGHHLLSLPLC